jgi:hypothetical protein
MVVSDAIIIAALVQGQELAAAVAGGIGLLVGGLLFLQLRQLAVEIQISQTAIQARGLGGREVHIRWDDLIEVRRVSRSTYPPSYLLMLIAGRGQKIVLTSYLEEFQAVEDAIAEKAGPAERKTASFLQRVFWS